MSSPVAPLATQTPPQATDADRRVAKLHHAAQAFESILVKQMLTEAKVAGEKASGYTDMAVDALATGVEKAGGLGLARRIEESLSHSVSAAHDAQTTTKVPW